MTRTRHAALALLAAALLSAGAAAQQGKPEPMPPAGAAAAPEAGKPEPMPAPGMAPDGKPAPADAGPGAPPAPAAQEESRRIAQGILDAGFLEGFFSTFWTGFRQSFVDSTVQRSGRDRATIERLADNTMLPIFRRARPELERRILDVMVSSLTVEQLRDIAREGREGTAEGVRTRFAPAEAPLQASLREWADGVLESNRAEILEGIRREGLAP
jgi:hypothetical protein